VSWVQNRDLTFRRKPLAYKPTRRVGRTKALSRCESVVKGGKSGGTKEADLPEGRPALSGSVTPFS
jgi:hypothetical protein